MLDDEEFTPVQTAHGHVREAILYNGEWVRVPGIQIYTLRHRGIWFELGQHNCRERRGELNSLIHHHTGGERGPAGVFNTLKNRGRQGLSVHFIQHRGRLYQLADMAHVTAHAGYANEFSVGVEHTSRGLGRNLKGHKRRSYFDKMHGRNVKYLAFHSAEVYAAQQLSWAWSMITGNPCEFPLEPGEECKVLRSQMDEDDVREWKGLLGHCHVTSRKYDPAPDLMDAIQCRDCLPPENMEG